MACIMTKRNFVAAHEPLEEDQLVQIWIRGEHKRHLLLTQPIDQYQAAVDWCLSMADQMEMPLVVVPITAPEYLTANREAVERRLMEMTDQERGDLRQSVMATVAEVLRDCDDPDVRADAYDVLVKMKVIRP